MARLRRKLQLVFNLYETTNENRLKTGGSLTASVYPAGVVTNASASFIAGNPNSVRCVGRGALSVGDTVYVLNASSVEVETHTITINSIEEDGSVEGVFLFTLTSDAGMSLTAGQRLVRARGLLNTSALYAQPTGTSSITSFGIDVPDSGVFNCYTEDRAVDVYVEGDTVTNGWYLFDVPAGTGEIGPVRYASETVAATAVVNVDATTTVVYLDTDTAAVSSIEHCAPNRMLLLVPTTSGIQITTANTKNDNTIYQASGQTIDLDQDVGVLLLGAEASANTAYWVPIGAFDVVDIGLTDLDGVDVSGAADFSVLHYDGAEWVDTKTLGSETDPLSSVRMNVAQIANGTTGHVASIVFGGSGDKSVTLPATTTTAEILTTTDDQNVTGEKIFDDDALIVKDPAANKRARLDAGSVTTGQTRVLTVQDKSYTIADAADIPGDLDDLSSVNANAISAADQGDVLVFDGSEYTASSLTGQSIGVAANPQAAFLACQNGLYLCDETVPYGGAYVRITTLANVGSGTNALIIPTLSGNDVFVIQSKNNKAFTKSVWWNPSTAIGPATPTDGETAINALRLLEIQNAVPLFRAHKDITITEVNVYAQGMNTATGTQGDYDCNLYHGTAVPTAATAPPGSSTAILNSVFNLCAGSSPNAVNATTFADDTVPAGNWVYLSLSGSVTTKPNHTGITLIQIDYTESAL